MLLAIDVGNTETVVGLFAIDGVAVPEGHQAPSVAVDGESARDLAFHWRLSTASSRTTDEYAVVITQLLDLEGLDIVSTVTGVAISSSVPEVTGQLRRMAARWLPSARCVVLGPGTKSGMPIRYANPKEVGADRIANAVGAFDLYGGPCVVVDLGTATTFDAISKEGEYLGGAIAPGVGISIEALYANAAALRSVELVEPRAVVGQSTEEAIQSGVLYGFAAQVDGMCERFEQTLGESTVVLTGGLSSLIAPYTSVTDFVEPWLTLHGLRLVYDRNSGGQ